MHTLIHCLAILALVQAPLPTRPFHDLVHQSKVFAEARHYRIILPLDYETSRKAYPVIYFFHGHSDRYTLESYDDGKDFIPKMVDYVAGHDVIVVLVDGYVARDYTGFYGGFPWDVLREGGDWDFGAYFQELVGHIDDTFRTLADRRHRAVSGLSMGGFMSLWLSSRYPDLVASASAFNPGPEFFAGDKGRRSLWRPKDHVSNHSHSMVRLIRASGDYISQYHEETRAAYANADDVDFEYRVDEYDKHWITSIAETFDFHARAFRNSSLDNVPVSWNHSDCYSRFAVWGYQVSSEGPGAGFTYLDNVTQGGFRVTTRQWAPDGPPLKETRISITTDPRYEPGKTYTLIDYSLASGQTSRKEIQADGEGRLAVAVDGAGHEMSFAGPGTGAQPPELLPLTIKDRLRLPPGVELSLPLRVYNPRADEMKDVTAELSSEYPTVQILAGSARVPLIRSGDLVDLSRQFRIRMTAGAGYFAPTRLRLRMVYDGWYEVTRTVDILVIPEVIPEAEKVEILDGKAMTFKVFRQAGNQGGGGAIDLDVIEGKGNGNGVLEPGEEATVWVLMKQGMDAFDKNTWHRCKVYSDSPWIAEVGDVQNQKQREWTSALDRTSLVRMSPETPKGTTIPLLLDNQSWSFHYTPDVRYGKDKLYQAFQLHSNHLHRYEVRVE